MALLIDPLAVRAHARSPRCSSVCGCMVSSCISPASHICRRRFRSAFLSDPLGTPASNTQWSVVSCSTCGAFLATRLSTTLENDTNHRISYRGVRSAVISTISSARSDSIEPFAHRNYVCCFVDASSSCVVSFVLRRPWRTPAYPPGCVATLRSPHA